MTSADIAAVRSRPATSATPPSSSGWRAQHVRHAVVTEPGSWPRTFTLKEIVRRGAEFRARSQGEPLQDWLAGVHDGRERAALLGDAAEDDIADPMGGPMRAYVAAAAQIEHFTRQLAGLCWGIPADTGVRAGDAAGLDIPRLATCQAASVRLVLGSVAPGDGFVVGGVVGEAAVEDADEAVAEGA